jgi:putative ABC transport system permease protein
MTLAVDTGPAAGLTGPVRGLAVRFAWRDLRGGLRGFGVFIACIALGVLAIAGVGSVAASLNDGIGKAGRLILGGDLAFSLIQREADVTERAFLAAQGTVSVAATLRAMARPLTSRAVEHAAAPVPATLVEVKAVDDRYPLFGTLGTDPALPPLALLAQSGGTFGAATDALLLTRLGLKIGDRISIGDAQFELRATLTAEPDKLAGGISLGPRLLISEAALRTTGLLQPGSLVRWQYRLRLPEAESADGAIAALEKRAQTEFPQAGWEVRSRGKASPQLERNVERFSQFLTLVGLATLLVGGVGIANAVASHLARNRDSIATLKALGATGSRIFAVYCTEILVVALFAALIGAIAGAALPFAITQVFGATIPLPVEPQIYPPALALAVAYGLLTALAFSLWPLGRAHDIPVAMLFRDQVAGERRWPRARYIAGSTAIVLVLAALAVVTTYDHRIAAYFLAAAAAVFLLLWIVAAVVMWIARRAPRAKSTVLRLAVANMHRAAALTPSVMLSLGLGLAILVTLVEIDGNLHRQFAAALPDKAPSFFFIDIPAAQAERFDAFMRQQAPDAKLERVPMLRGRIVAANGVNADELKPPDRSRWVLRGDRGITYAQAVPPGSRIVDGQWWGASYSGEPLVSLEARTAHDLELKIGDTIAVNVLGRNVTARIANLRAVDWENLGINFVLVFSPGIFDGAPHSDIATLTFADGGTTAKEAAVIKALGAAFPAITAVRVKDALDAVDALVGKLILALRGASAVTLVAAALVLGGALAASQRFRIYDAVVLKTFGATRAQLTTAYALEYFLIGLATAVFAVGAGTLAGYFVITGIMEFPFEWVAGGAVEAVATALGVTMVVGLAGTFGALSRKPAAVLRNL